jgi:hypothetical protein
MTCPRVISDILSKIYPGHIGPIVRKILLNAEFPVLLPSTVFKPWKSLVVMFGGSNTSIKALCLGAKLAKNTKTPLYLFTQNENKDKKWYEDIIKAHNEAYEVFDIIYDWYFLMEVNLNQIFLIFHMMPWYWQGSLVTIL